MSDQKVGLSRGSSKHKQFIQNSANNYVVEAFVDVSAVAPGSGLPAAADGQQYAVDSGSGSLLGGWGTITGLQDKDVIRYRASKSQWERAFVAAAGEEGAKVYDKDSDTIFAFDGADWNIASGAGGGVKNFAQRQASGYKVTDLTSGNSVTFGDSGTLDGTLSIETASPLEGKKSWLYTTGSSSENDWFYYTVDIDAYASGGVLAFVLDYLWDGEQPLAVKILDELNNELNTELNFVENTDNISKGSKNSRTVFVQTEGETTVRVGFQVPAGVTAGKVFKWDNLVVTDNIGVIGSGGRVVTENLHLAGHGGIAGVNNAYKPYFADVVKNTLSELGSFVNNGTDGFVYTALKPHTLEINADINTPATGSRTAMLLLNNLDNTNPFSSPIADRLSIGINVTGDYPVNLGASVELKVGDTVSIRSDFNSTSYNNTDRSALTLTATAQEEGLRFLQVPNGEKLVNDFSARVNYNAGPQLVNEGPVSWIDSVVSGGVGIYNVTFKPGFFSEIPALTATCNTSDSRMAVVHNQSISGCTVRTRNDTGAHLDTGFVLKASRDQSEAAPNIVGVPVSIQGQTHEEDSAIWLHYGNGYGSSNVRRFSQTIASKGNALSVIDNATDGTRVNINESGLYHVSYGDITTNQGNMDMSVVLVGQGAPIAMTTLGAEAGEYRGSASGTVWLPKGSQIFCWTNVQTADNGDGAITFKVAKVGTQPLIDGGLVERPGSQLRFEGVSGVGSAKTKVAVMTSLVESSAVANGDVTYTNDSIDGLAVTIQEDGIYGVNWTTICDTDTSFASAVSRNAYQFTTNAYLMDPATLIASAGGGLPDNVMRTASTVAFLRKGDIIRPHVNFGRTDSSSYFMITKLGQTVKYSSRVYKEDPIAYQTKFVSGITSDGLVSGLTFNNLEPGKTYRIYGRMYTDGNSVAANQGALMLIQHNGVNIQSPSIGSVFGTSPDRRHSFHFDEVFTASATTLEAVMSIVQNSSSSIRWTLEELPFHAQTSKWT